MEDYAFSTFPNINPSFGWDHNRCYMSAGRGDYRKHQSHRNPSNGIWTESNTVCSEKPPAWIFELTPIKKPTPHSPYASIMISSSILATVDKDGVFYKSFEFNIQSGRGTLRSTSMILLKNWLWLITSKSIRVISIGPGRIPTTTPLS
ncbi:hypothetical protein Glove_411g4 [Diversispora epigaea]|uniref:Uncharacterized protein n=1 Tax=Diversispora epigaea TaxID=1348612 RepID=A0A397H5L9_9GLOM|nr:hypothetical protein Glove_411g4 [Diversispora epigaea]